MRLNARYISRGFCHYIHPHSRFCRIACLSLHQGCQDANLHVPCLGRFCRQRSDYHGGAGRHRPDQVSNVVAMPHPQLNTALTLYQLEF